MDDFRDPVKGNGKTQDPRPHILPDGSFIVSASGSGMPQKLLRGTLRAGVVDAEWFDDRPDGIRFAGFSARRTPVADGHFAAPNSSLMEVSLRMSLRPNGDSAVP
jgi:hypothetical protein